MGRKGTRMARAVVPCLFELASCAVACPRSPSERRHPRKSVYWRTAGGLGVLHCTWGQQQPKTGTSGAKSRTPAPCISVHWARHSPARKCSVAGPFQTALACGVWPKTAWVCEGPGCRHRHRQGSCGMSRVSIYVSVCSYAFHSRFQHAVHTRDSGRAGVTAAGSRAATFESTFTLVWT